MSGDLGAGAHSFVRVSRRAFLLAAGGAAVAVSFASPWPARRAHAQSGGLQPSRWVRVNADGRVTIFSPAAEMGQGVMTALPLAFAEEMDLDWERVRVEQAPADAGVFGNPLHAGRLATTESRSVAGYFELVRLAGMQARNFLLATVAGRWGVPVDEIETEPHVAIHRRSGRRMGYGEISQLIELPQSVPPSDRARLKPADRFRLIGKVGARLDVPDKITGRARYGMDVRLPQMLFATVLRSPVPGSMLEKLDDSIARKVSGVRAVVSLPYGVGVIADTYWAARKARAALRGQWSQGGVLRSYSSDRALAESLARARNIAEPGIPMEKVGAPDTAFAVPTKVFSAEYAAEHVAHACMEPMNCTARILDERLEVWAPAQSASEIVAAVSRAAGVPPDNVRCHVTLLGGGLGRRMETDYAIDAALLARAVPGRAVKVVWTREDDIQHDKYRPLAAQHLSAILGADGLPFALRHRVVSASVVLRRDPARFEREGGADAIATRGATGSKYAIPNRVVEFLRETRGPDVGLSRGAGAGYTKFALETFIDELAAAARRDPLAYRLALLATEPRARAVLEDVARMAQWAEKTGPQSARRRTGRALGLAYSDLWDSHVALVAEVSVDAQAGRIRVHEVWCAVDCGLALQPVNVAAQVESGVIQGLSQALLERVTFRDSRPQQSNFNNYPILRIGDVPKVTVKLLASDQPPAGVGEIGLPPIAPAVANAVAALTGRRLRKLPLEQQQFKAA